MAALAVVGGLAVVARQSGTPGIGGLGTPTPSTSGSLAFALATLGVDEAQAPEAAEWASSRPSACDVYRSRADGWFDSLDRIDIDGQATLRRFTCAGIIADELLNAFPGHPRRMAPTRPPGA